MLLQESRYHVGAKSERHTSVVLAPPCDVLVWIRPQQVAEQSHIWDIGRSHHPSNLLHCVEIRTESSMHGKDLFVDDGSNRQTVETISKRLPQLDIVAPFALVIESVYSVDGGTLVVTSQDEEILRILDLVREQQTDCLQRLLAPINVITQKEIVCFGRKGSVLK
ncbi:unnamed protein product [Kuraishia capsulata CBS 1993]|uniref:Uncharacterized protein n=1 Tax=Kuraishia capsulata CBS 1993 TaxID=1382522 RepID=W6MVY6_9ASCO|nr:uncharacterized protein KUCA_T00002639001 [Kuraishia capsulata CBS 1993]CDK26665.1 unnamed protein product [Kuraishia capsulata CBS 1993]